MPKKTSQTTQTAPGDRPTRRITGPRLRKCRSCGDLELSTRLIHGECPECIGLQALPLRGAGGRFMSFTPETIQDGGNH